MPLAMPCVSINAGDSGVFLRSNQPTANKKHPVKNNPIISPILSLFMGRFLITALATTFILLGPQYARADLLLDFTGGNANTFSINTIAGWQFTLSSPVVVDGLGFWDQGSDGLVNAHDVGIWNSANPSTLLAFTTVTTAGSTAVPSTSSAGLWRFTDISPITLSPGTYVIGATVLGFDQDSQIFSATTSLFSGATFVEAMDVGGSTLAYPNPAPAFNDGTFGPNLRVNDVPEPASAVLLVCGAILYLCRRLTPAQKQNS